MNRKDAVSKTKPPMALIPPSAALECVKALSRGVDEYGAFNWRGEQGDPIEHMEMMNAAQRHFYSILDGEDIDPTSQVLHWGHLMATCAIVIDAMKNGVLIDNRPPAGRGAELIRAAIKQPVEQSFDTTALRDGDGLEAVLKPRGVSER